MLIWLERVMNVSALFVALGVTGEFVGNWIAGPIRKRLDGVKESEIAQLRKDTADANARAAEANQKAEQERLARIQLEAKIADRVLTPDQQSHIASDLKAASLEGQHATIVWYSESFEAAKFASQIEGAVKSAGWVTKFSPASPGFNGLPVSSGILIMTEPPERSKRAGWTLLSALHKERVVASIMAFDRKGTEEMFKKSTDPEDSRILVIIGSHP